MKPASLEIFKAALQIHGWADLVPLYFHFKWEVWTKDLQGTGPSTYHPVSYTFGLTTGYQSDKYQKYHRWDKSSRLRSDNHLGVSLAHVSGAYKQWPKIFWEASSYLLSLTTLKEQLVVWTFLNMLLTIALRTRPRYLGSFRWDTSVAGSWR